MTIQNSTIAHLVKQARDFVGTPVLMMLQDEIVQSISTFTQKLNIHSVDLYFPLKVNADYALINLLSKYDVSFEIASVEELSVLKKCHIPASKIIFGNPIKLKSHIEQAFKYGVYVFACDSVAELRKIGEFAAGSSVYFRLAVGNTTSQWPLDSKFGATEHQVVDLFIEAKELGLNPCGISFHVGWNNTGIADWVNALDMCNRVFIELIKQQLSLGFVNIGGGFPAHRVNQFEYLQIIAEHINPFLDNFRNQGVKIIAEPGSFLVANAGIVIASVIAVVDRGNEKWVFLDTGIMQGFCWIHSGLEYDLVCLSKESHVLGSFVVTGPTCDSHDVFSKHVLLPENICEGDLIGITPAGAYVSSSQDYNGFTFPKQQLI